MSLFKRSTASGTHASLLVRAVAISVLVIAPFAPDLALTSQKRSVVYVVDRSPSVPGAFSGEANQYLAEAELARAQADNDLEPQRLPDIGTSVVDFGEWARIRVPLGRVPLDALPDPERTMHTRDGTDLEAALRIAGGVLPEHGERRIVVLSDGNTTRGDARAAVRDLAREGVEVDVVPLGRGTENVSRVARVELVQDRVAMGEPIEARAHLIGPPGGSVNVRFFRDETFQAFQSHILDERGRATAVFIDHAAPLSAHTYSAAVVARGVESPRVRTAALVGGRPRALVVSIAGETPSLLEEAVSQAGMDLSTLSLADDELDPDLLHDLDLVILNDVPLERDGEVSLVRGLSVAAQQALLDFVRRDGGGVFVTGGAFSYGPNYAGAPITRMLPVAIQDRGDIEDPRVAMAIMLDRSGSMRARVGRHTKLELAVEAALAAASTLQPDDRVGIASVDTVTTWSQQLMPAALLARRQDEIRRMTVGGGGIFVYTALADAYRVLTEAPEAIRHVVIFSDTADSEEQYQGCPFRPCRRTLPWAIDLARDARVAGITTTVVGIGRARDQDTEFLQRLSVAGGGRFYLTERGADLRRIFVAETRAVSRSNLREERVSVRSAQGHAMTSGITRFPDLTGYVETERRATANTVLVTGEDDPLLASWRYGLGRVVALTTDIGGRYANSFAHWDQGGQLVRQITRFAARRRTDLGAHAALHIDGPAATLTVDLPERGGASTLRAEVTTIRAGERHTETVALRRVAVGRYRADVDVPEDALAIARTRNERGEVIAEAVGSRPAVDEFSSDGTNTGALRELVASGGGELSPSPERSLRATSSSRPKRTRTWPWLYLLAILLVLCDLALRRVGRARSVVGAPVLLRETPRVGPGQLSTAERDVGGASQKEAA